MKKMKFIVPALGLGLVSLVACGGSTNSSQTTSSAKSREPLGASSKVKITFNLNHGATFIEGHGTTETTKEIEVRKSTLWSAGAIQNEIPKTGVDFVPTGKDLRSEAPWTLDQGGMSLIPANYSFLKDTTIYAQWDHEGDPEVTVNWYNTDLDEEISGDPIATETYYPGQLPTYPGDTTGLQPTSKKPGHTYAFNRFIDDDGNEIGILPASEDPYTVNYRAIYTDTTQKFLVTFDSDGGTVVPSQAVFVNEYATEPTSTKTGYTLDGWYYNNEGTEEKFDFISTPITSNITLKAHWTPRSDIVITFRVDNYEGAYWPEEIPTALPFYLENQTFGNYPNTDFMNPKRTSDATYDYTFAGWNTATDGTGENIHRINTCVYGGLLDPYFYGETYYAQWTKAKFKNVTFNYNGYDKDPEVVRVHENEYLIAPADPSWAHHTFLGWWTTADDTGSQYDFSKEYDIENDPVLLYAHWTTEKHTVSFDLNGGLPGTTGEYPIQTIDYGETATNPVEEESDKPVKTGYKFVAWYEDLEGDPFDFDGTPITEDIVLIAKYSDAETKVTVNFNNNDGTETKTEVIVRDGEYLIPPATDPTRAHYTFAGWYTLAEGGDPYDFTKPYVKGTTPLTNLYAHWTPDKCIVTFDLAGGTGTGDYSAQSVDYNTVATNPAEEETDKPIKTGYKFVGWYLNGNPFDFTTKITADTTLIAKYDDTDTKVTVNFNNNDGTETKTEVIVRDGEYLIPPATDPTRAHYTFAGWYTLAEGGDPYDFTKPYVKGTTPLTNLYAHWTPDKCIVTFDLAGGTGTGDYSAQSVDYNTVATNPTTDPAKEPTRTGYIFLGWYESTDASKTIFDFDTKITANITLVAKWDDTDTKVTVNFNNNDGTETKTEVIVRDGEYLIPPATDPTRAHYTFAGWWTTADETGTKYDFTQPYVKENPPLTDLYAHWTIDECIVSFDLNGGTAAQGTSYAVQKVNYGEKAVDPTESGTKNPTKEGFEFNGWINRNTQQPFNFNDEITADTLIQAQWTPKASYTVTFDLNYEGHPTNPTVSVLSGEKVARPLIDPTREGFTFGGWYKEAGCTNVFNFETETITQATPIYAKWTAIDSFTVTFNLNYEGSTNPTVSVRSGEKVAEPLIDPTREGFTFGGWYKDQACTDGNEFDFSAAITADTPIYAKWTAIDSFTVTFNLNYEGSTNPTVSVRSGEKVAEPLIDPTREGFTFGGWYKDQACTDGNEFDFSAAITADTPIYAKWTAETPLTQGSFVSTGTTTYNLYHGTSATGTPWTSGSAFAVDCSDDGKRSFFISNGESSPDIAELRVIINGVECVVSASGGGDEATYAGGLLILPGITSTFAEITSLMIIVTSAS